MPKKISLSVVICTCDRRETLSAAIESVLAQRFASLELIVVDNSTYPKANADLRRRYRDPRFRYVFEPVQGLSHARNRGTALARGRYVAFLDDDAIAKPNWAGMLVAGFRKLGSNTACIGGRIVPRWLAPRPDWLTRNLLGYLSIVDWGGKLRPLRKKEWIAGCNIAFDRKALLDANGFPTALGRVGNGAALLSNDEIAVCRKLKAAGKIIAYAPNAVVEHQIPAERLQKEWFLRRASWQAVSDFIADPKKSQDAARETGPWLKFELTSPRFLARAKDSSSMQVEMTTIYCLTRELLGGSKNTLNQPGGAEAANVFRFLKYAIWGVFR